MICIDASALIEWLLNLDKAAKIEDRLRNEDFLIAPHLIEPEIGHVMRRFVRLRKVSYRQARQTLEDLSLLRIRRIDHTPYLLRAFELYENCSFYDAIYIVIAESFSVPLLTCDLALAAISGHDAVVEVY